jgi:hypothetical protein
MKKISFMNLFFHNEQRVSFALTNPISYLAWHAYLGFRGGKLLLSLLTFVCVACVDFSNILTTLHWQPHKFGQKTDFGLD